MFGITGPPHACTCMKHVLYLYRRYKTVQTCTEIDTDYRTQLSWHSKLLGVGIAISLRPAILHHILNIVINPAEGHVG